MGNRYEEMVPYLLDWYDCNARILAWREQPKPYYVWVSEIMLQQTRVEAVKGYFDRFITALPDIEALAKVREEELLKLWEGLGYYSRARNLKKAAEQVSKEYGGELPADYEKLLTLPGIGSYTAGAIASIAFQIPVPVIDGNVLRVTKRIEGSFDDITKDTVKRKLWQELYRILPQNRPGDFNQSLMELGATVCVPNGKPLCEKCPVIHLCRAFHEGLTSQIPVKKVKKERRKEERTILLIEYQEKYAIHKRGLKGLLAGLWELPGLEEKLDQEKLLLEMKEMGLKTEEIVPMGETKHIFSHVEWHMAGYHIRLSCLEPWAANQYVWATKQEITENYSIPSAFSAYLKTIRY